MPATLPWIDGKRLLDVKRNDYTWTFAFTDGVTICTESCWRLVDFRRVSLTSHDDGQHFGLPDPVNSSALLLEVVSQAEVSECRIAEKTHDLIIRFSNDHQIEILTLSTGYELWSVWHKAEGIACAGSGDMSFVSGKT